MTNQHGVASLEMRVRVHGYEVPGSRASPCDRGLLPSLVVHGRPLLHKVTLVFRAEMNGRHERGGGPLSCWNRRASAMRCDAMRVCVRIGGKEGTARGRSRVDVLRGSAVGEAAACLQPLFFLWRLAIVRRGQRVPGARVRVSEVRVGAGSGAQTTAVALPAVSGAARAVVVAGGRRWRAVAQTSPVVVRAFHGDRPGRGTIRSARTCFRGGGGSRQASAGAGRGLLLLLLLLPGRVRTRGCLIGEIGLGDCHRC